MSQNSISYSRKHEISSVYSGKNANSTEGQFSFGIARVVEVFSDPTDADKFKRFGGWKFLGSIYCTPFINNDTPGGDVLLAKPINRNISKYPTSFEIVLIMTLISKKAQNPRGNYNPEVYYFDIIPVFDSIIGNPCPSEVSAITDELLKKNLSNNKVRELIQPLEDLVIQGRQGSSLRFGKNSPDSKSTPWSSKTSNPIVVLTNNRAATNVYDKDLKLISDNPLSSYESVNEDGSSIYMLSAHDIGFIPASDNFSSYNKQVSIPEKNNVVVTNNPVNTDPTQSPQQTDVKTQAAAPQDPKPTSVPVKVPDPPKQTSNEEEDTLPEREDLFEIGQMDEDYEIETTSVGRSQTGQVDIQQIKKEAKEKANQQKQAKAASQSQPTTAQGGSIYVATQPNRGPGLVRLRNQYFNSIPQSTQKAYLAKLTKICNKYKIPIYDLETIMTFESGGNFPKGINRSKDKGVLAAGIIQWTDFKNKNGESVLTNMAKKFPSLKNLLDILDVPLVLDSAYPSKYNFDQLDMLDYYFSLMGNRIIGADRYAMYGCIFYPIIVENGRIRTDLPGGEDWVLGYQSKKDPIGLSWTVAKSNPGVNNSQPISIKAFKNFVDSLFNK